MRKLTVEGLEAPRLTVFISVISRRRSMPPSPCPPDASSVGAAALREEKGLFGPRTFEESYLDRTLETVIHGPLKTPLLAGPAQFVSKRGIFG